VKTSLTPGNRDLTPTHADFERRTHAFVAKRGVRTHCATGLQTLVARVGRAGVKD
jgi:hypothetical protein